MAEAVGAIVGAITVLSILLVTVSEAEFQYGKEDSTVEDTIRESFEARNLTPVSNVGHFGSKDNSFRWRPTKQH